MAWNIMNHHESSWNTQVHNYQLYNWNLNFCKGVGVDTGYGCHAIQHTSIDRSPTSGPKHNCVKYTQGSSWRFLRDSRGFPRCGGPPETPKNLQEPYVKQNTHKVLEGFQLVPHHPWFSKVWRTSKNPEEPPGILCAKNMHKVPQGSWRFLRVPHGLEGLKKLQESWRTTKNPM